MGKLLVLFCTLLLFNNQSQANMLMGVLPPPSPVTVEELPEAPAPGESLRPVGRPQRGESCAINPNQEKCIEGENSVERDVVQGEDVERGVVERSVPNGPSSACENSVASINQCSSIPQISVSAPRGNILGNYDAVTETMRSGSNTLSQYSSQCQALMSQCVSACSSSNSFDQNLRSQCYRFQSQVGLAEKEAKNLNAMSLETERAAEMIRTGASDFKKDSRIGRGTSLAVSPQIQNAEDMVQQVSDKPLLSNVKLKSFNNVHSEESEDGEFDGKAVKRRAPIHVASTTSPIKMNSPFVNTSSKINKNKKVINDSFNKKEAEMFGGFFKTKGRRNAARKNRQERNQHSLSSRTGLAVESVPRSGLLTPEEVLQMKLEQRMRDVASGDGLSRSDMFIFHSICIRYDAYEKNHGINEGSSTCPPAY